MIANSTRMMVRSEGYCLSSSSVICQSTTLRAPHTPISHSSFRKLCVGTSMIKGARKMSTLGRGRRKHLLGWEPSKIACRTSFVTRSLAYVCNNYAPQYPSNRGVGEEAALFGQGGRSHSILVFPYHKKADRGKVSVGYRFDDAKFERCWRYCESCPDLLDC